MWKHLEPLEAFLGFLNPFDAHISMICFLLFGEVSLWMFYSALSIHTLLHTSGLLGAKTKMPMGFKAQ